MQGSDGNFYGTTVGGGYNGNAGTVFKISATGALTTLYSFPGGNDGAYPQAGLVQGSDGNLYGTTSLGGNNGNAGTVFKISATGALTTLYSFTGAMMAEIPEPGWCRATTAISMARVPATSIGRAGTVFKISDTGALTTLYSFPGGKDGGYLSGLVQGSDGNFYGTTANGGTKGGGGTVFRISSTGALTTLYSFTGGKDGGSPRAGLVQGSDGNFYGTTAYGGGQQQRWHGLQNQRHWGADHFVFIHWRQGWRISLRRAGAGQRRQFLWHDFTAAAPTAAMVRSSKSALLGR